MAGAGVCRLIFSLSTLALTWGWRCSVEQDVCDVWLTIEHRATMMDASTLVIIKDGLLFPFDAVNFTIDNSIPKEKVITADGYQEPRLVIAVNGSFPAPTLEVYEHQTVRVHVRNNMASETTSLHFHGMFQRGTPWMDGVGMVTQCPILPGQSFTYQFTAEPAGTNWYHSHMGGQMTMGLAGPFIVHPRPGSGRSYDGDVVLMVQDWNHEWEAAMTFLKMQYGMYVGGRKVSASRNLSGAKYSNFYFQSGLINGRGRFHDASNNTHNGAPLEIFNVSPGGRYRFRVIHSGSVYPFKISVDGHQLTVVASDSHDIEHVMADAVIVTPGERYDFEVNATRDVDNYWIRAESLEVGVRHVAEAILHYEGSATGQDPTSSPRPCSVLSPCVVVNCPFKLYPPEDHIHCITVDQLRGAEPMPPEVGEGATQVKDYFLNFAFPGNTQTPASVNGVQFLLPTVSALTQPTDFTSRCPGEGYRCQEDRICQCSSVLDLEHGEVAQMVLLNLGKGKGWDHPVHMHGHSFWVVKVGFSTYNDSGFLLSDNQDIDCRGSTQRGESFCNNATWADPNWSSDKGGVPGLLLSRPVRKDTVNVPTGGYVVIRIKADNPGLWAMHCHVLLHLGDGMMLLLNESFSRHPPPPPGFHTCGDFNRNSTGDIQVRQLQLAGPR